MSDTTTPPSITVTDLNLNPQDDDDSNPPEDQPRRLLDFGHGDVLAWGGETGRVSCYHRTTTTVRGDTDDATSPTTTVSKPFGHWDDDDDVRAVAVHGNRVAVGLDTGGTLVYTYDGKDNATDGKDNDNDGKDTAQRHPFLSGPPPRPSQTTVLSAMEGALRDVQFRSRSLLAVASEEGLCVIHVDTQEVFLQREAAEYHRDSGVRAVAFGRVEGTAPTTVYMASLGLDGRLVVWDASADTPSDWTRLSVHETGRCVTKADVGELMGADAWDRSCRPHFLHVPMKTTASRKAQPQLVLALPGETYLQFRTLPDCKPHTMALEDGDPNLRHIESIVSLATPQPGCLVTTGRDARVLLWTVTMDQGTLRATCQRDVTSLASAPTHVLVPPAKEAKDDTLLVACADGTLVAVPVERTEQLLVSTASHGTTGATHPTSVAKPTTSATDKPTTFVADLEDSDDEQEFHGEDSVQADLGTKSEKPHTKTAVSTPVDDLMDSDEEDQDKTVAAAAAPKSPSSTLPSHSSSPASASALQKFVDDQAAAASDNDSDDDLQYTTKGGADATTATPKDGNDSRNDDDDDTIAMGNDDHADDHSSVGSNLQESPEYDNLRALVRHGVAELPPPQPPFAPSSSPLDLPRRFLCWNHIGSVTLRRDDDTGRSNVDIHFTDSGYRRPIGFTDNQGFILGSLGEDGGIFVTDLAQDDEDEDEDILGGSGFAGLSETTKQAVKRSRRTNDPTKPTGSSIFFHRYESFASIRDKDWFLTLPSGERGLGCATGEGWAAVVTSRRFLRLYSAGGNQGRVLWLEGPPVTMAGRGRFLAVFYHKGEPWRDGTQQIGYKLMDVVANRVVATGQISCLGAKATLSWVGFDNDGSVLALDSMGMLSMLVCTDSGIENSSWEWMPMLDTLGLRKSSDDSHWPITVYDGKLVCVPLKGGTKYPDASRRPVTAALSLRLPLARSLLKSSALEELSIRAGIALGQKKAVQDISNNGEEDDEFEQEFRALSAQVDKVTLKMFAATLEAGKLERALDLVERLNLEKSFELAMTVADNHRKLVDLIEEVKDQKFGGYQDHDEEDTYDSQPATTGGFRRPRISPDTSSARKRSGEPSGNRIVRQRQAYA